MKKSRGTKTQFKNVIILGGVILSACLIVCLLMVSTLKGTYESEISESFMEHHLHSGQVMDDKIATVVDYARKGAGVFSSADVAFNHERTFQLCSLYKSFDEVCFSAYLTGDTLFFDREIHKIDELPDNMKELFAIPSETKHIEYVVVGSYIDHSNENGSADEFEVVVMDPVFVNEEFQGYFIIAMGLDNIFDSKAFAYENSFGECYLIDKDAYLVAKSKDARILTDEDKDFGRAILAYCDGKDDAKRNIQVMRNEISRRENGYVKLKTSTGQSMQVSYYCLDSISNVAFVCCYSDNLVDNRIQPLIYKNVFSCMVIILMMILSIIYVWASNKTANILIEKLAYEDGITGGKNINYFKDFALDVMSVFKETPFLIYRFDISNFRYINESYGHKRADEVLVSCIKNFEEVFSDKELCVRMTADQFLAIIVNDKTLATRMKTYTDMINADARSRGIKFPIRFKSGIYQVRKHDHDIDIMIDHANVARKTLGGDEKRDNQAFYSDAIVTDMRKVDRIESDMQRALATGEFKVFYQPKWDVVSDHVAGAEALIRWIKADGTMVYPDVFIPIFEKNGFVEKLDFYTLETVCQKMRELLDEGRTVYPVSVNQSRLLLHSPDYVDNVTKIIEKYEIPANAIELEITETVFLDERENMIDTMEKLKKCGVRLSMDDFGSGYSSLNMLKDAPFDIIKIDREFFSESITSDRSMWILQKIIEMINGLGMEVICEGVETGEQSAILRDIGCRLVQGYFYSKPVPTDEYVDRYCELPK